MEKMTVEELMTLAKSAQVKTEGLPYVIVRSGQAGVFAGYLEKKEGDEVTLVNSRKIHYWNGAAAVEQLSQDGVTLPASNDNRFTLVVPRQIVLGVAQILYATEAARKNIEGVFVWKR